MAIDPEWALYCHSGQMIASNTAMALQVCFNRSISGSLVRFRVDTMGVDDWRKVEIVKNGLLFYLNNLLKKSRIALRFLSELSGTMVVAMASMIGGTTPGLGVLYPFRFCLVGVGK